MGEGSGGYVQPEPGPRAGRDVITGGEQTVEGAGGGAEGGVGFDPWGEQPERAEFAVGRGWAIGGGGVVGGQHSPATAAGCVERADVGCVPVERWTGVIAIR